MVLMVPVLWLGVFARAPLAAEALLEPDQAFRLRVEDAGGGELLLHWYIAPGYYLYRDRLALTTAQPAAQLAWDRPAGETKADPNFGSVQVYHRFVDVQVHAAAARSLEITWQGCAEEGVCYPPQHRKIVLDGASSSLPNAPEPASSHVQAWAAGLALALVGTMTLVASRRRRTR